MKTRSPQITGEECPVPGNSVFQLKSFSVNVAGKFGALPRPEPFGPRKRVHSWAPAGSGAPQHPRNAATRRKSKRGGSIRGRLARHDDGLSSVSIKRGTRSAERGTAAL